MWQNACETYLENRVLSASPTELVHLLYQGCISAVRDARHHLEAGEILLRSRSISKACDILTELTTSLDHERGGEISQRLAQLYDYLQRRLLEANIQQRDEPLAESLGLLTTLCEAWAPAAVKAAESYSTGQAWQAEAAPSPWASDSVGEYASAGWSL